MAIPPISVGPLVGLAQLAVAGIAGEDGGIVKLIALDDIGPGVLALLPTPGFDFTISRHKDIEGVPIEGRAGTVKLFHGIKEAEISIPLRFTDDGLPLPLGLRLSVDLPLIGGTSPEEKLEQTVALFEKKTAAGGLMTFGIDNRVINASGIRRVVFAGFDVTAPRARDWLDVTVKFTQHEEDAVTSQRQFEATPSAQPPLDAMGLPTPTDTAALDAAASHFGEGA